MTSSDTRNVNTSNQFINNTCELIAQAIPSGTSPATGILTGKVWIKSSVPTYRSSPYVQRHYEIGSAASTAATGRITLYFTQSEFTAFNTHSMSTLDLPASASDSIGKTNLKVIMFSGTSVANTGAPESYSGSSTTIDPDDSNIVWSEEYNRWEISFDVSGFGGFIVQAPSVSLPVVLEYFKGSIRENTNFLTWKANCSGSSAIFNIERSEYGTNFQSIGSISSTESRCLHPFDFTDLRPLSGGSYYRIRIKESTGGTFYSNVVFLQMKNFLNSVYPTLIVKGAPVQVIYSGTKGYFSITDGQGRVIYKNTLSNGFQSFDLSRRTSGVYFYTIKNDKGLISSGKLIIS